MERKLVLIGIHPYAYFYLIFSIPFNTRFMFLIEIDYQVIKLLLSGKHLQINQLL
jgi:hypothetical protein